MPPTTQHDTKRMKLEHVRAFGVSNGLSLASILPTMLLLRNRLVSVHNSPFWHWYLLALFRLTFMATVLDYFTKHRREQHENEKSNSVWPVVWGLVCVTGPLEAVLMKFGLKTFTQRSGNPWYMFVPQTFALEVMFDLGHYTAHRLVHSQAWLYKLSGHKIHHSVLHPTAFSTFHQEMIDTLLSNVLPWFSSLLMLDRVFKVRFTPNQYLMALGLKTYVEVAGHVGVLNSRATSFPQFVWLPRALGIALQTKDHDLHHTHGGKHNFAKRFTLFDKLFGTYHQL